MCVFCSFVGRIFDHALEDSHSKSGLVHSLSVCISLLDPKRTVSSPFIQSIRSQHMYESHIPVNPETVGAMLPKLGKNGIYVVIDLSHHIEVVISSFGFFCQSCQI